MGGDTQAIILTCIVASGNTH